MYEKTVQIPERTSWIDPLDQFRSSVLCGGLGRWLICELDRGKQIKAASGSAIGIGGCRTANFDKYSINTVSWIRSFIAPLCVAAIRPSQFLNVKHLHHVCVSLHTPLFPRPYLPLNPMLVFLRSLRSAKDANSTSTQTFLTALILNGAICAIEVLVFVIIRRKFRKVYQVSLLSFLLSSKLLRLIVFFSLQPRSYLPPRDRRSDSLPPGLFAWLPAIFKADPEQIIHKNGLDAYYFLRFLRLMGFVSPLFFLTTKRFCSLLSGFFVGADLWTHVCLELGAAFAYLCG